MSVPLPSWNLQEKQRVLKIEKHSWGRKTKSCKNHNYAYLAKIEKIQKIQKQNSKISKLFQIIQIVFDYDSTHYVQFEIL